MRSLRAERDSPGNQGQPTAARAVAAACAANPVALLIPSHRMVREDGSPIGYRWDSESKRALLEVESRGW